MKTSSLIYILISSVLLFAFLLTAKIINNLTFLNLIEADFETLLRFNNTTLTVITITYSIIFYHFQKTIERLEQELSEKQDN